MNALRKLAFSQPQGKWLAITNSSLIHGRAVVTTEDGKRYTIFNLGMGPFAGQIEPGESAAPPSTDPPAASKTIAERASTTGAPYKAKGYLVASIVSIMADKENAIIGRQNDGVYFKTTLSGSQSLSAGELTNLPQSIRDALNERVEYPLVWLIDKASLKDADFNDHYHALLEACRRRLFGHTAGTVIVTLSDPRIAESELLGADGKLDPRKLASRNLDMAPHAERKPFALAEIQELVTLQVPDNVLIGNLRATGIAAPIGEQDLDRLHQNGASQAVIEALRQAGEHFAADSHTADLEADAKLWASIDQNSERALQNYLDRFPDGTFAELARHRLAAMAAARSRARQSAIAKVIQPATICAVKMKSFPGKTYVDLDGHRIAFLEQASHFCFQKQPGDHFFDFRGLVSLKAEAGQVYYLEYAKKRKVEWLHLVSRTEGQAKVSKTRPISRRNLYDQSIVTVAAPEGYQ